VVACLPGREHGHGDVAVVALKSGMSVRSTMGNGLGGVHLPASWKKKERDGLIKNNEKSQNLF
jgi:hypothetical protein